MTDGKDGYLFADLDRNDIVGTGDTMSGVSSLAGFTYCDII
jgi:hypothetical protein